MIHMLSWNMAHRDLWPALLEHDIDAALLQEAAKPSGETILEVLPTAANPVTYVNL